MKLLHFATFFLLIWITKCDKSKPEPKFSITRLGHSGLLIKCEIENEDKGAPYVAEYMIKDTETNGRKEKYFTIGDFLSKTLLNLSPNTKYTIEAYVKNRKSLKPIVTVLEAETNQRSTKVPFKPDFKYKLEPELYSYSKLTITWLPCGKQNDCGDFPAGEHFYVKYQEIGANEVLINRDELIDEIFITGCHAGKRYKFVVVSVYGYRETESDPQEITFPDTAPDLDFKEVVEGENITIPCKITNLSKSKIHWKFPKAIIENVVSLENGDLFMEAVPTFHSGKYDCHTVNQEVSNNFSIFLDVKGKTRILNSDKFQRTKVNGGDRFYMPCLVKNDNSLNVFVDWLKNGEPIDFDANLDYQRGKDNALIIEKTVSKNSADYTCIAKTRLDSAEATLTLQVK